MELHRLQRGQLRAGDLPTSSTFLSPHRSPSTELEIPSDSYTTNALPPITRRDQTIVLLSTFATTFVTIGPNLSYGIFQAHYRSSMSPLPPDQRDATALIALVGTFGAGLTWGSSIFIHPLLARCASCPTVLPLIGAFLTSSAFLLASFSHSITSLMLTQGLLYGVGSGFLYFPNMSSAPPYFDAHRGSAMGLMLSAAGVGGLAYSVATRALISSVGSIWTLRIIALVTLVISLPAALSARPNRARGATLVPLSVAKKPAFVLQALAALLQAAGNFVPMTFATEFSSVLGYSAGFGALLLGINNGVNAASRIITGALADALGRQNVLVLSAAGSSAAVLGLWLTSVDTASSMSEVGAARGLWIGFVVLYGMLAGGYSSLFPTTIGEVFGPGAYASVNSFLYFARGIGALFGSPVGGQILGGSRNTLDSLNEYRNLVFYDGALLVGCAICVIGVRGFDAKEKKSWKWKA